MCCQRQSATYMYAVCCIAMPACQVLDGFRMRLSINKPSVVKSSGCVVSLWLGRRIFTPSVLVLKHSSCNVTDHKP